MRFGTVFANRISTLVDQHVPMSFSGSYRKSWMNKDTANAIDKKKRAWTRYKN